MRLLGDKSEPGLCECPLSRPRIGSLCSGDLRPAGEQGAGSRARGALRGAAAGLRQRASRRGCEWGRRRVGPAHTPRGQSLGSRAAGPGKGSRDGGGVWPRARRRGSRAWCGGRERPFSKAGVHNRLNRVVTLTVLSLAALRSVIFSPWKSQPSLWLLCSILHTCTRS